MSVKESSGYVLLTTAAREAIQQLTSAEKGELLANLEWLRDHSTHPAETKLRVAGRTYEAVPFGDRFAVIFRPLTVDELLHQGRKPLSRGIVVIDIVPIDEVESE